MKDFYKQFLTLSRGKQIAIVVCSIHLLAILGLLGHHLATSRFKTPRPMVVKMVQLLPEQKKEIKTPATTVEKPKPAPKKEVAQKPKPEAKKTAVEKPKTVAKAAPKPAVKEEKALKEIAESLASLTSESRNRPLLNVPSTVKAKDRFQIKEEPTYGEYLIAYLQNALDLPEYGEVKAKIEIDRFGKLIDCEIVEAKSVKNAEFLKNQLPDLTFPCLNDFGIVDTTHTFTITFRNVETR